MPPAALRGMSSVIAVLRTFLDMARAVGGAWRSLLTVTPFFPGSPGASVGATRMPPRGAERRLHYIIRLEHVCYFFGY